MALIDSRTVRVLVTTLFFALGLGFLYIARRTLIAFLFAIFFAYLVDPAVSRLEKWTRRRGLAIAVIYLLFVALLGTLFFFIGPRTVREARHLGEAWPTLTDRVNTGDLAHEIGRERGWSGETTQLLQKVLSDPRFAAAAQQAGLRAAEGAKQAWLLIVVPILAVFFLKDGRGFSEVGLSFVQSRPQREFLQEVLADLNQMLAHFIRAQLELAALSMVVYISFMEATRVPYALVLGTAGGMMEFIPVVGPLVAAVVILSVALLMSYKHWLLLLAFLIAWRLVQDYVVSPRIMGKSMELHPLAAIFGVLAGGEIAGVLGVYLSIPVMASLRIVWRRWRVYAEKKRFGPLNEYSFGTEISPRP
ncbi:MAG: AI-2E family transporter [Terriglobales bacterium]